MKIILTLLVVNLLIFSGCTKKQIVQKEVRNDCEAINHPDYLKCMGEEISNAYNLGISDDKHLQSIYCKCNTKFRTKYYYRDNLWKNF